MKIKKELHPRNKFREAYDYRALIGSFPELAPFVIKNKYQVESIDFFDPKAVLLLNKALLKHHYQIDHWDIPKDYLCPPIPGRSDYIHIIADLLASDNSIPKGSSIRGLDIGVGSACIYPIIGSREYDWSFVASDIDSRSIESSRTIVNANPLLAGKIELRIQSNSKDIFKGIIQENEFFDFTMCNPPFHRSKEEARSSAKRKIEHLSKKKGAEIILNFGGKSNELWYEGGERAFLNEMINQSKQFANAVYYFSSIVSQEANLKTIYKLLKLVKAHTVKTIPMNTGNKKSRVVAWTFKNKEEQKEWLLNRLKNE